MRLNASKLASDVQPSEDELRRYYDETADSYMVDEQRKASHILLGMEEGKTLEESPEVSAKLAQIQDRLKSGEAFEELAREFSDDPGSAQQGGDLGQVLRGVMVPPFEEALFALQEQGQISEPVLTSFGVHLIRLDEITPRKVKSFEEVREQISTSFVSTQAVDLFYDRSERMAELAYENPDNLSAVAEATETSVISTDWVSADNDSPGVEGNQDVLAAVFSERLKNEQVNSDPIEIDTNDVVIVRVTDSRPQSQLAFEEVTEQARRLASSEVVSKRVLAYAEELLAMHEAGENLQQIADSKGLSLVSANELKRQANELPGDLSRGVFSMSSPKDNKPVTQIVPVADAEVALVRLRKVSLPAADTGTNADLLGSRDAARDAQMLLTGMRENAEVTIFKDKL